MDGFHRRRAPLGCDTLLTAENGHSIQAYARHRGTHAMRIWNDKGRWKAACRYSSSGDTWIGFCKLCKITACPLAGKTEAAILTMAETTE